MGKLKQAILNAIRAQINKHGLVVWYDPEKRYSRWLDELTLDGVNILRYRDGFFRLRQELEPFLEYIDEDGTMLPEAEHAPAVLVYVPAAREDTCYALIEAETAGAFLDPAAADRSTSLGYWVEKVFGEVAPPKAHHLARQADEGLLTLEELDEMAEDAIGVATGILQVVFGQNSSEEILLQFLASDAKDATLNDKHGQGEMIGLIRAETGYEIVSNELAKIRSALLRFVLLNDLFSAIPDADIPDEFAQEARPTTPMQREVTLRLCELWRKRLDLKEAYVDAAIKLQKELRLDHLAWPMKHLMGSNTFELLERLWLSRGADLICRGDARQALELSSRRSTGFWTQEIPSMQMEWRVIEAAATLVLESIRVSSEQKKMKTGWDELIQAYTGHAEPWLRLDRVARQLGTRYALLESVDVDDASTLEKAVVKARQFYTDAVAAMAEGYAVAAIGAEFVSKGFSQQTTVYRDAVKPRLAQESRVAYFLVDALRYEMAAELHDGLAGEYDSTLSPVLGQLPGVTQVGMAALLPHADQGMELQQKGKGIQVMVAGKAVNDRVARINWLAERSGVPTIAYKLGEVTKLQPRRKKEVEAARLIVVTSQEIDRLGEEAADEEETRRYMDEVLDKLRRAIRSLAQAGVTDFVICADHGFHLIEAVDPGLSMNAPGGETVELHARAWIGFGGKASDGYVRMKANEIDLGGALEFAFPKGLATFKVFGGAGSYFHGGISPQEHVLPLLTLHVKSVRQKSVGMTVKLTMSKQKITNRLFTVTLTADETGLFIEEARRMRVEIMAGKTDVGCAVAAAEDFSENTHEVLVSPKKANVVTLMLQTLDVPATVNVQAVDCETGLVLGAIKDIPVELAF